MTYIGELISIGVAFSWTATAMASEVATKRMGVFVSNVWRMALAFICSWDDENGLGVLLVDEKIEEIGYQDIAF